MGLSSSDPNENPWESASNDQAYKSSHSQSQEQASGEVPQEAAAAATSARLNWHEDNGGNLAGRSSLDINRGGSSSNGNNEHNRSRRRNNNNRCGNFCKGFSVHHILHTVDATVSLSLLIFVGYTLHYQDEGHHGTPSQVATLLISTVIAVLIVWRALMQSWLFPSKRCSKSCSTHLTLLLCGSYTVLSLTAWIILNKHKDGAVPWCWSLGSWCAAAPRAAPLCLTVLALVEGMRFLFAQGQMAQFDRDHPQTAATTTRNNTSAVADESFTTSRRNRPWWWNRREGGGGDDSGMHEALLGSNGQPGWTASGSGQSYLMDDGVGTPASSRRFLGGLFGRGRSSGDNNNPRDDGSIDYASLNEEWASRTEEDPYWWTREENNPTPSNTT